MRARILLPLVAGAMLIAPATASADFAHVVLPGESLSSVAAVDGLSVAQLAAANGLSTGAHLVAGSTLMIPPQGTSVATTASSASSSVGDGDGDSDDVGLGATRSSSTATAGSTAVSDGGSYIVQPGDSLSAIAARAGMSVSRLAALNGLDPNRLLLIGTTVRLGGGAVGSGSAATTQPVGATAEGSPSAPPYPTPERVSASEVGNIAAAHGVPPSLAQAIGWQESGFNNDLVSSAGARGVMQILPGTWSWINGTLSQTPLAPASATSNVTGGVLMLRSLLNATGGDPAMAAAGYYQGLPSVHRHGLYSDTQQYVNNVMSLARHFGGG